MRKGWKKAVSTMLCAAMILSMSSFMVSADGEPTIPETPAGDATTEVPGDEKDPEEQPPVNEEKDPADEEKDPADEEKDPADEEKDPADEEKDPADEEKDPADEEKDPADEEKDPADGEKDPSEVPGGPEQPSNSLPMAGLTPATPAAENGIMPLDAQSTSTPDNEEELKAALTDTNIDTITINSEISISNPIEISRKVTITGSGTLKDIKSAPAENGKPTTNFITITADDVTIEGITIQSGAGNKYAVQFYKTSGKLNNVKINHGGNGWAPVLVNGADVEITGGSISTTSGSPYALIEMAKGDFVNDIPKVTISNVSENSVPLLYADGTQLTTEELAGKITVNGQQPTLQVNGDSIIVSTSPDAQTGVASVNGVSYATLKEAIDHVGSGGTITILKDIPNAAGISVPEGKDFTIDFDGHTYTLDGPGAGSAGTETNAFQLLKNSTITFKNGTIRISERANNVKRIIQNYADLTLENMQIYAKNQAGGEDYPLSFNNGEITFKGNTSVYTSNPDSTIAFDVCKFSSYPSTKVTFDEDYTGTIQGKIVYDSSNSDTHTLTINGNGHFGKIDYSPGSEDAAKEGIEISGGTFTESVDDYVVDYLNFELNSNGLYSYYATLDDAKQAAGRLGGTIINRTSNSVTIVPPSPVSDDTDRPSGSHNTGSSSSSSSNSNVSYHRDPEQDKRDAVESMWKRAINKINSARDGSSLKIYTGIVDEIPDYVLDALRENNVTVTFYNQDGDEVTIPAGMAPKSLRDSWTFKQLGNYVLSLDEVVTEVEETTETTQPAAEQNAEQNAQAADNTAKPNPETGDASSSMMAIAAAAASLCGVVLLSKKNK